MLHKTVLSLSQPQKAKIFVLVDLIALTAALLLVQKFSGHTIALFAIAWQLPILLGVAASLIHLLGLNRIKLNAYGMEDITKSFGVATALLCTSFSINFLLGAGRVPFEAIAQFAGMFLLLSISFRVIMHKIVKYVYDSSRSLRHVLIYGAGQTGQQMAAALLTDHEFKASCFVDDNPNLQKLTINGLRVYHPNAIPKLVRQGRIDRIVLAMPSADQRVRMRLAKRLSGLGCEVLALPSFADIVLRGEDVKAAAPLTMDSLLGRDAIKDELPDTESAYRGRRILVTGAGGSIGGELCRQLARCEPAELVLLDHCEFALYKIANSLRESRPDTKFTAVLGSIEHAELIAETLQTHEIDVVFHAAAYKHVGLVQENAFEGIRNNVLGTRIVAEEAQRAGVERFILVSTDKAVRPTSMMGSSKRVAELVIQDLATRSTTTKFSMVRFGNVLGSSGSVIPLFQQQIREMGPVTVTHPDVTRYFMTIDEAVRLVLLAGTFSRGGDVFVLDMGTPVSIYDMARKMIAAAGYTVRDADNTAGDIEITFTGLKEGEKMHEELLIGSDMLTTPHPKILRAQENLMSELEVASALQDLRRAVEMRDAVLMEATLLRCLEADQHPVDITALSQASDGAHLTLAGE
ncbi:polysaccharide biosynthesis protein [Shimia sp. R10_1]|uniref:polysaccharide biosynthesis protein n=1 Tax=Shimia sp. R10_1 TaxID=2821095 RepID=UPI001ADB95D1|nr:nucleoside-diphosphate sugar epimerase/dehydratase [Shimia sp. R10_1]MBO9473172.1 polysaccharide biosynthesis protein [Shimia sp. R10_1]